jgi:hypothetical protein
MVKLILSNEKMVTLVKGNKKIQRSEVDYETNKKVWDFKGFKVTSNDVEDNTKEVDQTFENEAKVIPLKKKRKTRKKKDEQIN